MKQAKFIFIVFFIIASHVANAQVAINKNGSLPDSSAILDLSGTDGGFLLPRMMLSQRNTIANPAVGLLVYCTDCKELQLFNGEEWVNLMGGMAATNVPTVTNPATGRVWMDRNLGASQVADSSDDLAAYGDLYQWGRLLDGHEIRQSTTVDQLSDSDDPGHNEFISTSTAPQDWRSPQNPGLWQGLGGINNPCPPGFRLPTEEEWNDERLSWDTPDADGAFNSVLRLPLCGIRLNDGELLFVDTWGGYWSSTISATYSKYIEIKATSATVKATYRAVGCSVRCIKD